MPKRAEVEGGKGDLTIRLLNQLYETKDKFLRFRPLRKYIDSGTADPLVVVDVVTALEDSIRVITKLEATRLVRAHPREMTKNMLDDMTRGIAAEQKKGTFPRFPRSG